MKTAYGDKSKLTPAIHQHYVEPLQDPAHREGCMLFPKAIIGSTAWLSSLWSQRELLAGKVKLIAWGMKDIAFREKELNFWIDHFPMARVVRFADAGHFIPEEKSAELIVEMSRMLLAPDHY
jgi:haloalkane dehalogenase